MWWCRQALLSLALVTAALGGLAGCGFHPVYGTGAGQVAASEQLNRVNIGNIPNRSGQQLRNLLIDRFYTTGALPESEDYRLNINLTATERKLGVRRDASATRGQMLISADFQLQDIASNKVLYRSNSSVRVSYNILDAPFATLATKDHAYERGLVHLADDIRTRVGLYFARAPEADADPAVSELAE